MSEQPLQTSISQYKRQKMQENQNKRPETWIPKKKKTRDQRPETRDQGQGQDKRQEAKDNKPNPNP